MDGYVIVTCIGKGSSGAVYLARSNRIKKLVAIKKIQIDESRRSRCRRSVIREANILRTLNHFHIVKCYEWFLEEQGADISMVLEYCDGGTMQDRIASVRKNNAQIPERKILEWTAQITSAVEFIHDRKILHRDLKSENVFLLKSEVVKLGDFGISKEVDHTLDKANTCVGTPCYLSPELCQDIPYNFKSDIWALGCLVFEMCALKPAFDAANLISLFYKIVNGKYSSLPEKCSPALKDLISKILVRDPDQRPTAQQLLQLPSLQRYTHTIRTRSPELISVQNHTVSDKKSSKHKFDTGDLDDLDELLSQAEKEFGINPDITDENSDQSNCNRSLSVYDNYGTNEFQLEGFVDNDSDANRPQTCPHSASKRPETYTPADTIATWSGYGDRGSKRPSATHALRRSSGESDSLSDASTLPDQIPTQRDYSSDEFSSLSDDDYLNTSRTAATVDEEIPEEIESFVDDTPELQSESGNSANFFSMTGPRNLPGSAWLQSKRAQVLRQSKQLPPVMTSQQVIPSVPKRSTMPVTSYSLGSKTDFVAVKKHSSMIETSALSKKSLRKERLPGSSWLKCSSRGANEIVLGAPVSKIDRKKRDNLPGSGWLLSKSHHSPQKEGNPDDYPDDFEDYDDDFENEIDDQLDTTDNRVSSLELVKQKCIDSIGKETFDNLGRLFKKGFSIGEAYEKCKNKVPFETVETCYLLLN